MTAQWIRAISLIVDDDAGKGIDLSNMRIVFRTKQRSTQSPNSLVARIYNLSWNTAFRVKQEFTRVQLKAGYKENISTIFTGTIIQSRIGRENPTDTFLEIVAQDGDVAYNFGIIVGAIAAGWTSADQYKMLLTAFQAADPRIQEGYHPEWSPMKHPGPLAMSGNVKDYLAILAERENCEWSIDFGVLNFIPIAGVRPGPVPVLSAATGLIGMPQQTSDGIEMRCLLNPNVQSGRAVKLDNSHVGGNNSGVQEAQYASVYGGKNSPQNVQFDQNLRAATDGYYKVLMAEHFGDTRGNPWDTFLICVPLDGGASTSLAVRGWA